MLTLHHVAKMYHRRPSEIAGIRDEWAAYQFDAAVLINALDDKDEKGGAAGDEPVSWDWSDLV